MSREHSSVFWVFSCWFSCTDRSSQYSELMWTESYKLSARHGLCLSLCHLPHVICAPWASRAARLVNPDISSWSLPQGIIATAAAAAAARNMSWIDASTGQTTARRCKWLCPEDTVEKSPSVNDAADFQNGEGAQQPRARLVVFLFHVETKTHKELQQKSTQKQTNIQNQTEITSFQHRR